MLDLLMHNLAQKTKKCNKRLKTGSAVKMLKNLKNSGYVAR